MMKNIIYTQNNRDKEHVIYFNQVFYIDSTNPVLFLFLYYIFHIILLYIKMIIISIKQSKHTVRKSHCDSNYS